MPAFVHRGDKACITITCQYDGVQRALRNPDGVACLGHLMEDIEMETLEDPEDAETVAVSHDEHIHQEIKVKNHPYSYSPLPSHEINIKFSEALSGGKDGRYLKIVSAIWKSIQKTYRFLHPKLILCYLHQNQKIRPLLHKYQNL